MLKMFETQLSGLLRKLEDQEMMIEDSARMTAQTIISDGNMYIAASPDLGGIVSQSVHGADPIPGCNRLEVKDELTSIDTVWLFTSSVEGIKAEWTQAADAGATVVLVIPEAPEDTGEAFVIETKVTRPLLPTESGGRIGEPHLLVSLHVYYALYFQLLEMLEEHED
ncbi:DUF2529 family protein [Alkalicoccus daliensis]|uniref:DUF2529 domain-containing protein n=1 Tax=Alkalicoccus daliensis TaxID=745820 RepID=A0A1H0KDR0_9BACI|nr:DUF2529 family protein [Alkalicoccus daliensis]SDO53881.1 protein of unknown function [Alkalicoccus daliensis]